MKWRSANHKGGFYRAESHYDHRTQNLQIERDADPAYEAREALMAYLRAQTDGTIPAGFAFICNGHVPEDVIKPVIEHLNIIATDIPIEYVTAITSVRKKTRRKRRRNS